MKTLVIGATGLLGKALVRELLIRNKEVRVTIRKESSRKSVDILKNLGAEIVFADIRDKESLSSALDQVVDVYFMAALFKPWFPDTAELRINNIDGVENVLEACLKNHIRKVVYTSSHGTIGLVNFPAYADETTPILKRQNSISDYLESKFCAERIAQKYFSKSLNIVIVNPVGIIGINDFADNPTNKFIKLAAEGQLPKFYVNAYTCIVNSRDAAIGHILAMEKGRPGERYILGGENITFRDYFSYLHQLTGSKRGPIKIPIIILLFLSYLFEWRARLTLSSCALAPGSVKFLMKGTRYSSKKAQEELGYCFRPIRETIKDVYQWFKEYPLPGRGAQEI